METILLLVRHGETVDNANQIMQGQSQGELNEKGIEQARETRDKLLHEPIDVFISSDLKRSIETCRIIAEPHGKPIETTPLIRERDWGGFTGCFIPDLKDKPFPPDVETIGQMKERARRFLEFLRKKYPGKCVLAVGHGIMNKAILSVFHNKPMNEIQRMENAEVRSIVLTGNK
ncbi:MAG: histidine phosphatase family protein [Prevotella sp.]|nr:histidine phosphatase family protein [Prevotella sp.]